MARKKKLKRFVDEVRHQLLETIDETHKTLMDLIEGCFDQDLTDEAMKADKVRSRFDAWRDKFMFQDPVKKIFKKHQKEMLKEKKRFRGIILILETFLVEATYLEGEIKKAFWLLKNPDKVTDEKESLSTILDEIVHKIEVFDENLEFYSQFYKKDLGLDTEDKVKEQMLQFFKKKELKKMIRYVKWNNIDKLERKFLDETDLVEISPSEYEEDYGKEDEFAVITPKKEFEVKGVEKREQRVEEPKIREIKPKVVTKAKSEAEERVAEREAEGYERITLEKIGKEEKIKEEIGKDYKEKPRKKGEKEKEKEKEKETKEEKKPKQPEKESNLVNFIKKIFGKTPYDDDIKSWVLQKGEEYQKKGKNTEALKGLYQDLRNEHPEWTISPKDFLKIIKSMTKKGLLAKLEKLDTGYYMLVFQPVETTNDPNQILLLAKEKKGVLSREEIISELEWTDYRAQNSLDYLIDRGIAKTDTGFINGQRYYFAAEF